MPDSVYKVIEVIGTSTESWEKAASVAVNRASKTLRDLRVAADAFPDDVKVVGGHRLAGDGAMLLH